MPINPEFQDSERLPAASVAGLQKLRSLDRHACFEIIRSERVSVTSILFSGNDWRWRFRSATGKVLAQSEGYSSEQTCRAAITALQRSAGSAQVVWLATC